MTLSDRDLAHLERQAAEAERMRIALTTIPPEWLASLVAEARDGRAARYVLDDLQSGGKP